MSEQLIINPEYQKLVPALPKQDYEELKKSIQTDGLYHAIVINYKNEILDGHHRYQICNELDTMFTTQLKKFNNHFAEKRFVIETNLRRRHLELVDRAHLADELQKLNAEEAREKQKEAGKEGGAKHGLVFNDLQPLDQKKSPVKRDYKKEDKNRKKPDKETNKKKTESKSGTRAAKANSLSAESLRKYQYVMKNGTPQLIENMTKKWIPISRAFKIQQDTEKKEELMKMKPIISLPKGCDLRQGDFLEQSKNIPDNSIDMIFTDPPYTTKDIPIYETLGKLAARVLKKGGSLITYVGQYTLPEIIRLIGSSGLNYWWIFCIRNLDTRQMMYQRRVFVQWRPLLWYVKGEESNHIQSVHDYIESKKPEKAIHEWEQSTTEGLDIIEKLSVENQIILDPFMGSGTTGVVALKLKRKFIGIELDKDKFTIAKNRITNSI